MSTAPPWRASASVPKYSSAPAYIPVQARRSLAQPSKPTSNEKMSSAQSQPMKPKEWPQGVREYVQRSFGAESQIPGVTRQEMETKLKEIITNAANTSNLHNIKWESLPLPQEMIRDERNEKLTRSYASIVGGGETPPQKRKSSEYTTERDTTPPWRKANQRNVFEDRSYSTPTEKKRRVDNNMNSSMTDITNKNPSKLNKALELRRRRFEDPKSGPQSPRSSSRGESPATEITGPIIGRCETLEKNYFRLTSAPNPDVVRPLPVLRKTLELLKKKWRTENNYGYVCDQFKSMRQDLTVQHIKNEFTVNVYEIHARIALEKGDLGEYNQCQTQLRALYAQNLGGHPMEFKAYRILYFIYTRNQTAINDALTDMTVADKSDPAVKHALDVRAALAQGNYHRFFQLYLDTPNMGAYLMDMFVDRERLSALACICRAYKPDVKIRFITEELGFESDEQSVRFILDHAPEELLQEKDETVKLMSGKAGQTFEQAKASAHRVIDIKGQI